MTDKELRELYSQYLNRKSIAIVGGADNYNPKQLNNYEIIVRINNHWFRQRHQCDVVYNTVKSPNLRVEILLQEPDFNPAFLWLNRIDWSFESGESKIPECDKLANFAKTLKPNIKVGYFAQGTWVDENPYGEEYEWLNSLHKKYDCILLTGLVALAHILYCAVVKEIFVCGMTLYKEENNDIERFRGIHWLPGNLAYLQSLRNINFIKFDSPLENSLDAYDRSQSSIQ
jgi:hypothetical protein